MQISGGHGSPRCSGLPGYGLFRFFPDMEAGLLLLLLGSLWGLLWLGTIPLFRGPLARRFQNMDIPS